MATEITLGGVTFTPSFGVGSVAEDWDSTHSVYKDVVLTDNNGKTGYMAGGTQHSGIDIPTGQAGYRNGKVTVVATLTKNPSETDEQYTARNTDENLDQALDAIASQLTSQSKHLELTIGRAGNVRISEGLGDGEVKDVYLTAAESASVTMTLDLVRWDHDNNGATPAIFKKTWAQEFYFSVKGSSTAEDVSNTHSASDKLTAVTSTENDA